MQRGSYLWLLNIHRHCHSHDRWSVLCRHQPNCGRRVLNQCHHEECIHYCNFGHDHRQRIHVSSEQKGTQNRLHSTRITTRRTLNPFEIPLREENAATRSLKLRTSKSFKESVRSLRDEYHSNPSENDLPPPLPAPDIRDLFQKCPGEHLSAGGEPTWPF